MANQQTNQTANQQLKDQLDSYRSRVSKSRKRKRIAYIAGLCLVAVAIVGLVLPAATLEFGKTYCGQEEHTHTDACVNRTIVCALPDTSNGNGHVHVPSCYDEQGALACGKTPVAHMHLANCVNAQGTALICGQEETVHMHTVGCINPATNTLACDTEGLAHVHGVTCYSLGADGSYVLVCKEPSVGHVHTELCLDPNTGEVACGMEEAIELSHIHTDACYDEELICGMEEHVHNELCYDEITEAIMKKDEESSAAKEAAEEAEGVEPGVAEGDLTEEEITEAKDQGLLFENDAMIVIFEVPDKYAEDIVLTVTETDDEVEYVPALDATEQEDTEGELADDEAAQDSDSGEPVFFSEEGEEAVGDGAEGVSADAVEAAVAETEEEPAYKANLHVEATLAGVPVEDISALGIKAKLQMKPKVIAPLLNDIDYSSVDPEVKDEVGAEIQVLQMPSTPEGASISEVKNEQVDEVVVQSVHEAATTFELVANTFTTTTVQTANPTFTVQFYALVQQFSQNADPGTKDVVLDKIIDTSGGNLPVNGKGTKTAPGTAMKNLILSENNGKYRVKTEDVLTEMYTPEENNKYIEKPNASYFNKLQENGNYEISEVWVLKPCPAGKDKKQFEDEANKVTYGTKQVEDYWKVYKNADATYHFTNRQEIKKEDYIFISDGAIIRLVNSTTSEERDSDNVQFYDYDITNGSTTSPTTTKHNGINNDENYSNKGTKLAFGNVNTGTGLGAVQWNGNVLNGGNTSANQSGKETYEGCTFGLVTGLNNGEIQYADKVDAPKLFNEGSAIGKTEIPGSLTFKRLGDSYTLQSAKVNGKTATSNLLTEFNHPSPYSGKTHTHIYTNNFWPMDKASTYGTAGHDIKFGSYANRNSRKYYGFNKAGTESNSSATNFPYSDDGKDHNSFFGMKYEIEFDLSSDYIGPLEYLFFGDDDLWVFLDNQLVLDIGGVHSSVGEYTNLWDYLEKGSEGHHKLSVFYTERGASGSTCFMAFTLPSVSSMGESRSTGSLEVSKKVDGAIDNPDEEFVFNIKLYDTKGTLNDTKDDVQLIDDFAYVRYDANKEPYIYEDEEGNAVTKETLLHDDSYFRLKAGERIFLSGLPINTRFVITEVDEKGTYLTTSIFTDPANGILEMGDKTISGIVASGNQTNGEDTPNSVIVEYTNAQAYELPATGGEGTHWYWIGGGLLVALALLMLWRRQTLATAPASSFTKSEASVLAFFGDTQNASPSGKPESVYSKGWSRAGKGDGSTRKGGRY